jgi:glycosyltransferase involved in cell wall biosynthesis
VLALDLQGTQSLDHRDRGVARYVRELALAIERLDASAVETYVLNPDLPAPGGIEPLVASGKLRFSDDLDWSHVGALHVASPYELSVPVESIVPPGWRGRLAVTLFDLVSEVLAGDYLADPGLRRRYRARHELVRQADLVLAISQSAASDGERLLGLRRERIVVTPLAPSASFTRWDGEREPYVVYTGGTDHRKNVEGLLRAWGLLPERLRRRYRLRIVGKVDGPTRNHYEVTAGGLGFGDGLDVTGWVSEDDLVRLTQRASLAVFPALYEGYGLPVAEALACGTPVIASNTSSLPELLPADALFDPTDVQDIAGAIERALAHPPVVGWTRRTWDDVAADTLAAYATTSPFCRVERRGLRHVPHDRTHRGRRRVAVVTPLPPVPGGVSTYSRRLLTALAAQAEAGGVDVHAFVDGAPHERAAVEEAVTNAPGGVRAHHLGAFERLEAIDGPFDRLVVTVGNSEHHTGALDLLRRRRGRDAVVLAHDVRLTGLHRFAAWQHPDATPGGFHATLHRMYGGALPIAVGQDGRVDADDAERWGVLMARDVIARSARFLVTSPFAAHLARVDARDAADRAKVAVVPFAVADGDTTRAGSGDGPPVVASFGLVDDRKQIALLTEAMAAVRRTHGGARLVFVGPTALDRVDGAELTGRVGDDEYRRRLAAATVAVQLRATTNGESSAAVGDCLAAGVPTVVTGIGAARDLPDAAVRKVAPDVSAADLAAVITALLDDTAERRRMSEAALAYAREHTFDAAARALYRVLFD